MIARIGLDRRGEYHRLHQNPSEHRDQPALCPEQQIHVVDRRLINADHAILIGAEPDEQVMVGDTPRLPDQCHASDERTGLVDIAAPDRIADPIDENLGKRSAVPEIEDRGKRKDRRDQQRRPGLHPDTAGREEDRDGRHAVDKGCEGGGQHDAQN